VSAITAVLAVGAATLVFPMFPAQGAAVTTARHVASSSCSLPAAVVNLTTARGRAAHPAPRVSLDPETIATLKGLAWDLGKAVAGQVLGKLAGWGLDALSGGPTDLTPEIKSELDALSGQITQIQQNLAAIQDQLAHIETLIKDSTYLVEIKSLNTDHVAPWKACGKTTATSSPLRTPTGRRSSSSRPTS
jgi:hypothetical protein